METAPNHVDSKHVGTELPIWQTFIGPVILLYGGTFPRPTVPVFLMYT